MADKEKDEFTLDENDDFPETDLSGIFDDAEEEADAVEEPVESAPAEPESAEDFAFNDDTEPPPPVEENAVVPPKAGGARTRVLLGVLLLVIVGAAGLYYLRLPEENPFDTEAVQTSQQVVAVPAPQQTEADESAGREQGQVPVVVASESDEPLSEEAVAPSAESLATESGTAPNGQMDAAESETPPAASAGEDEAVAGSTMDAAEASPDEVLPAQTSPGKAQDQDQAASESSTQQPTTEPVVYRLDAGAFLFPAQREEVKKKIVALGYDPLETEVKASVRLIRISIGAFPESEIPEQLVQVRRLVPDAFSMRKEGQHVIYAGSFANHDNVQRQSARLREAGYEVTEEPVKIEKVLSRIRFGSFEDDEAAEAAAQKAEAVGIPARVVQK